MKNKLSTFQSQFKAYNDNQKRQKVFYDNSSHINYRQHGGNVIGTEKNFIGKVKASYDWLKEEGPKGSSAPEKFLEYEAEITADDDANTITIVTEKAYAD